MKSSVQIFQNVLSHELLLFNGYLPIDDEDAVDVGDWLKMCDGIIGNILFGTWRHSRGTEEKTN